MGPYIILVFIILLFFRAVNVYSIHNSLDINKDLSCFICDYLTRPFLVSPRWDDYHPQLQTFKPPLMPLLLLFTFHWAVVCMLSLLEVLTGPLGITTRPGTWLRPCPNNIFCLIMVWVVSHVWDCVSYVLYLCGSKQTPYQRWSRGASSSQQDKLCFLEHELSAAFALEYVKDVCCKW